MCTLEQQCSLFEDPEEKMNKTDNLKQKKNSLDGNSYATNILYTILYTLMINF